VSLIRRSVNFATKCCRSNEAGTKPQIQMPEHPSENQSMRSSSQPIERLKLMYRSEPNLHLGPERRRSMILSISKATHTFLHVLITLLLNSP